MSIGRIADRFVDLLDDMPASFADSHGDYVRSARTWARDVKARRRGHERGPSALHRSRLSQRPQGPVELRCGQAVDSRDGRRPPLTLRYEISGGDTGQCHLCGEPADRKGGLCARLQGKVFQEFRQRGGRHDQQEQVLPGQAVHSQVRGEIGTTWPSVWNERIGDIYISFYDVTADAHGDLEEALEDADEEDFDDIFDTFQTDVTNYDEPTLMRDSSRLYHVLDNMRDSDDEREARSHYEKFIDELSDTIKDYQRTVRGRDNYAQDFPVCCAGTGRVCWTTQSG